MKRTLLLMIVALAVGALASTAHADMWVSLDDGLGATKLINDNDGSDTNAAVGVIDWSGILGSWTVNDVGALSKPFIGGPTSAEVHLNSLNVTNATGGTMVVKLSDTDFTLPAVVTGPIMTSTGGVVTDGTVTLDQILDPGNALFGTSGHADTLTLSDVYVDPGGFTNQSGSTTIVGGAAISITEFVTITPTAAGTTSLDVEIKVVPVTGAVLLAMLGLSAAGIKLRKFA